MPEPKQTLIPQGPNCAAGLTSQTRLTTLEKSDTQQWKVIKEIGDTLNKRLPHWATLLIAVLTAFLGFLTRMAM